MTQFPYIANFKNRGNCADRTEQSPPAEIQGGDTISVSVETGIVSPPDCSLGVDPSNGGFPSYFDGSTSSRSHVVLSPRAISVRPLPSGRTVRTIETGAAGRLRNF